MRIVIMGAGGVGGYFGAHLAQAGHDVAFVARGSHLKALQDTGLRLEGPRGNIELLTVAAAEDPASLAGPADVILFTVKLYDTEAAAEALVPIVGDNTQVISLQNGVDGPGRMAAVLGERTVLGGAAYVSALITEPGTVRYTSDMSRIVFGEMDGRISERTTAFAEACRAAGFEAEVSDNIRRTLWEKFILLATNAAMTTVLRKPAGEIYHDPELAGIARRMMEEGVALARAEGIVLADDVVDRSIALTQSFPPGMYASMYHDLVRGRRLEAASLSGLISRRGEALGVPVPLHTMAWAALKLWTDGET